MFKLPPYMRNSVVMFEKKRRVRPSGVCKRKAEATYIELVDQDIHIRKLICAAERHRIFKEGVRRRGPAPHLTLDTDDIRQQRVLDRGEWDKIP